MADVICKCLPYVVVTPSNATSEYRGYLACALAMEALKQYITVKYVRMADFLLECTVAWDEKRYDKVL